MNPKALVAPSQLIPARAHAHGVGRRVFKQRVGPGHDVGIVRIRRGVHRVAAGRRNDADVLLAVNESGGRQHHAQRGGFAAAHAGAGAADVEQRALGQHHVGESFLVDELAGRFGHALVEVEGRLEPLHVVVVLADHLQRIVIAAGIHAFGAALALRRVDEDSELAAADAFLLEDVEVLVRRGPLVAPCSSASASSAIWLSFSSRTEGSDDLAQNGGIRTLRDAFHAADAVFGDEQRNIGSDIAEVAQRAGSAGNDAARHLIVGDKPFSAVPAL